MSSKYNLSIEGVAKRVIEEINDSLSEQWMQALLKFVDDNDSTSPNDIDDQLSARKERLRPIRLLI
jgi:hypothetical protein